MSPPDGLRAGDDFASSEVMFQELKGEEVKCITFVDVANGAHTSVNVGVVITAWGYQGT